jgi:hypothetical protein
MPTVEELKAGLAAKVEARDAEKKETTKESLDKAVTTFKEDHGATIPGGVPPKESGVLHVFKQWKKSGEAVGEDVDEETIEVRVPFAGIPTATVGFNCKMTLNLGDYESVQVGVFASVPCYVEEMQEAFAETKTFVDHRLNKEVTAVREYRKKKDS